jgi:hypothetical protein
MGACPVRRRAAAAAAVWPSPAPQCSFDGPCIALSAPQKCSAMKSGLKHAGRAAAGMLPAALVVRLGMPALAALVLLAVLVIGVICWIINSDDRTGRVNRMMLARHGDARCLETDRSAPSSPASRPRRPSIRSGRETTTASTG